MQRSNCSGEENGNEPAGCQSSVVYRRLCVCVCVCVCVRTSTYLFIQSSWREQEVGKTRNTKGDLRHRL